MNFQSLHYFIMLAREKNFTRAAEKLHISQQTLSASIAALERELNCKLIIHHVPLELTYGGRTFFQYALSLTGEEESMRRSLLDIAEEKTGELRIGIGYVRGRTLLPPILKKFGDKHPGENVSGYFETLYLAEAPFTPFIRCMSNNMETLLCLSGKGMGALFCPQNLVRSSLSKEDLREMYVIPLPETKYSMSVGVRTKAAPWSIRDEFIQLLKEELAGENL